MISRVEFKFGTAGKTAVKMINHSDPSSENVLFKKIFENFVTKKFLEHELVVCIWVKIISRGLTFVPVEFVFFEHC